MELDLCFHLGKLIFFLIGESDVGISGFRFKLYRSFRYVCLYGVGSGKMISWIATLVT